MLQPHVEGMLVQGQQGLDVGAGLPVKRVRTDVQKGYIGLARAWRQPPAVWREGVSPSRLRSGPNEEPMNFRSLFPSSALVVSMILTLLQASAAPQGPVPTLLAQLLDAEKSLSDAQKRHDRAFVQNTLTDDFLAITTDGETKSKVEALSDATDDKRLEYRIYNAQVVPLNDTAAVLSYDVIVRMVHYDEDIPRYQRVSSIWVKQGNDWKLKFQQATAAEQHH